jgi:hypothetical protein
MNTFSNFAKVTNPGSDFLFETLRKLHATPIFWNHAHDIVVEFRENHESRIGFLFGALGELSDTRIW